ncbi:4-phosphoerythronate dehydrogenase PdxB [Halomonas sp. TD01]|uniref:4-phosphoerythronate dehydrogenase PdxB n=1 Tax=Halomonas sp. TD01 TaxID=999141 RepID=UPI000214E27D|nr:4-phosphoerythronate dehydrogenase PdxB [Halomonas sp. TD01]EGP20372.1 erythronate-4-phosphate dehydrogenase [Halomonas sp. TD01]CAH1041544.1 Erythronate-4-phosphate dehydrogenase (EC [Halomonas sp. TD01]
MKLVIDANIPAADACFGRVGTLQRLPGREIRPADVADADALIVRSITQVNQTLLAQSSVRFVGTCTIGTDHIDRALLSERGIGFASAPGCNADAVVDYVLSSLLLISEREGGPLLARRVGIVGAGNVGSRLQQRLQALGVETLVCDPPRAEKERAGKDHAALEEANPFVSLDSVIEHCDVVCLHTPLVKEGPHATYQLLNAERINDLAPGTVLLNAGRGDCIDGLALRSRLAGKGDITAILDVWEDEPEIDAGLRDLVALATPHIAGHSLDGKLRGTWMIQQALAQHIGRSSSIGFNELCPRPALSALTLQQALPTEEALRLCARAVYDVRRDHDALQRHVFHQGIKKGFDHCRSNYPLRREFATLRVLLESDATMLEAPLLAAGFQVQCV